MKLDARPIAAPVMPLALLFAMTLLRVHSGLNLADEGFLWYGAQRSLAGEVPLRDFMAYDPGRYYWTALWMWLAGDEGIVVVRWAAVLFEAVAIGTTAVVVWRETRSLITSALVCTSCVLIMFIWHGRYEPSVALLQVTILAALLARSGEARFFASGLQVGLAGFFGRNLALYGLVGTLAALALMYLRDRHVLSWRRFALVAAGVCAGSLPLVAMALFVQGFGVALWESILRHFELGATNIALPIPWPWTVQYARLSWSIAIGELLHGMLYIISPFLAAGVVAWGLFRNRRLFEAQPLFTAAAIVSFPYAHYVLSRADLEHLSRGGTPVILALALIPVSQRSLWRLMPAAFLTAALVCMVAPLRDAGGAPTLPPLSRADFPCQDIAVGSDQLCVKAATARSVLGARSVVERYVRPGESVLIAPYDLGLYPALGLRAPHWEIYPLHHAKPALELAEIERLEAAHTRLAIVSIYALDNRQELSYSATHPLIARYLQDNFRLVWQQELPPDLIVGVRPD